MNMLSPFTTQQHIRPLGVSQHLAGKIYPCHAHRVQIPCLAMPAENDDHCIVDTDVPLVSCALDACPPTSDVPSV